MEDVTGAFIAVALVIFSLTGVFASAYSLLDTHEKSVIHACETDGYWQYKQRRFICYEEKKQQ